MGRSWLLCDTRFDLVDVDAQRAQLGDSRSCMRFAGLPVAPLVVALVLQFLFVSLFSFGRFQVGGRQPGVHRAAYLFHGQVIDVLAVRVVVLLMSWYGVQVESFGSILCESSPVTSPLSLVQ